jgi:IS4 transposase
MFTVVKSALNFGAITIPAVMGRQNESKTSNAAEVTGSGTAADPAIYFGGQRLARKRASQKSA